MKRFLPILLLVVFIGWQDDRASCLRQKAPRATIQTFLRDNAEFQSQLARFDTGPDRTRHRLALYGQVHYLSRPELRQWLAARSRANAASLPSPVCNKPLPDTK